MKHALHWCAAASMLAPLPSYATTSDDDMLDIVITYSRVEQKVQDVPASVTIINRAEIEQQQATSVPDLLRGLPGISVSSNGGPGKASFINMRGTESDHVLVLIDGIKMGSATTGTTAFENLPIDLIDRIEIVRGSRSSIYGSEAIGGVIQIFTKRGSHATQASFSVGAGSYQTVNGSAAFSGSTDNAWFNASVSGVDSNGFNACNGEPLTAGCFTIEPDDDGYSNFAGTFNAGYSFNNGASVDVNLLRSNGKSDFDGDFVNATDQTQQILGVGVDFPVNKQWDIELSAGRSWDLTDNLKDHVFTSRFDTTRDSLGFLNNYRINDNHSIIAGIDYINDEVDSTTAYVVSSRSNTGYYGEYIGKFNAHRVQLGLRADDNEQFGSHTTGNVSWGYSFNGGISIDASYSTAFKAPTFNDLYFPGFANPDLRPETSDSFEFGISKQHDWGLASITIFQTDIDDLIAFDSNTFTIENIESARIRGLEAEVSTVLAGWRMKAGVTLLDPENKGNTASNGNTLPRRAKHTIRFDADHSFGDFSVGGTILAVGKRYDDIANTREMSAYSTLDLRGEYQINRNLRVQARLENLFDEDYEVASYYNTAGRSVFVTLRYQP